MNSSSLNSHSINGSALDASVRSLLLGYAYAIAAPVQRIHARNTFEALAEGIVIGNYIIDGAIHMRVNVSMDAQATILDRAFRRDAVYQYAYANATVSDLGRVRSPVDGYALCEASPILTEMPRNWISSPLFMSGYADATPVARIVTKSALQGEAYAYVVAFLHSMSRSPVSGTAEAVGFVTPGETVWHPFDEYATEANTFIVPYVNNVFYVR